MSWRFVAYPVLTYVVQAAFLGPFFGVWFNPNLMVLLVVSTAYVMGHSAGIKMGVTTGLLVDLGNGQWLGLHLLLYLGLAVVASQIGEILRQEQFLLPFLLSFVGVYATGFIALGLVHLVSGVNFAFYVPNVTTSAFYTALLSPLFFRHFYALRLKISAYGRKFA